MNIFNLRATLLGLGLALAGLSFPAKAQTSVFESVFANPQLRVTIWNTLDESRYGRCQVALFRRFIGGSNSAGGWETYISLEGRWRVGGSLPGMLSGRDHTPVDWARFLGVPRGGVGLDHIAMGPGRRAEEIQYLACGFVQEFANQSPISCGIAEFSPRHLTRGGYGYTAEERVGYLDNQKLACQAWPALRLKSR